MNRRVSPLACRCGVQGFATSSHLALAMLWNIVTNGSCDRSLWPEAAAVLPVSTDLNCSNLPTERGTLPHFWHPVAEEGARAALRNSQYLWMGSRRPSFDSCSLITSLVSSFDPYVPRTVPAGGAR